MIDHLQEPIPFFLLVMGIILITPILSERIRLPGIVGIILGGMLVGPYVLGLLQDNDRIEFLATIGLVYLMFSAGMEVDIHQFVRVRGRAVVFGFLTFSFPRTYVFSAGFHEFILEGFPIRRSPDHSLLAAPRGLSQLTTPFIAFWHQGIHHAPFVA